MSEPAARLCACNCGEPLREGDIVTVDRNVGLLEKGELLRTQCARNAGLLSNPEPNPEVRCNGCSDSVHWLAYGIQKCRPCAERAGHRYLFVAELDIEKLWHAIIMNACGVTREQLGQILKDAKPVA